MTVDAVARTRTQWAITACSADVIDYLILGQKSAKTLGKFFENSTLSRWTRFVQRSLHLPTRPASPLPFEVILVTKSQKNVAKCKNENGDERRRKIKWDHRRASIPAQKLVLQAKSVLWMDIGKYFASDCICDSEIANLHSIWHWEGQNSVFFDDKSWGDVMCWSSAQLKSNFPKCRTRQS